MAYQTRQRDPLLDDQTQEALLRFGQQAIGFALLGLGAALAALLLSYAPDDPNFMAATDAVPQNLLGRFGASVAAILMMIMGYGAILLPVVALAWGLRFLLLLGHERVVGRTLFIPIAAALASIYAASFTPPEAWTHSFGMGGLFGDTVLGAVLNAVPMAPQTGLKLLSALAFLSGAMMMLYVLGVSQAEFGWGVRFLILGLLSTGAMVSGRACAPAGAGRRNGGGALRGAPAPARARAATAAWARRRGPPRAQGPAGSPGWPARPRPRGAVVHRPRPRLAAAGSFCGPVPLVPAAARPPDLLRCAGAPPLLGCGCRALRL